MEGGADGHFVEVSLDSVLRKAADLEGCLRGCKTRLQGVLSDDEGQVSTPTLQVQDDGRPSVQGYSSPSPGTEVTEQWQKLTAYIVSLEKEVKYYKQLVEDVQNAKSCGGDGDLLQRAVRPKHREQSHTEYWQTILDTNAEKRVLYLVFSHLSVQERCPVSLVSRDWYHVSRHHLLWKEVMMEETVVHPEVLFRLAEWCCSVERLVLHGLMPPIAACDEDLQIYINKTRGSLEPGLEALMDASRESLTSLTITECNLMATERCLWLASVHCPNLRSLTYCSDEFPPSSESLWSLANGCRHLQHLTLPPIQETPNANWFNDNCLFVIAHAWPHLLSLTIGGGAITTNGLREIAQRNSKLEFLEVIYGPSLHKDGVQELCSGKGFISLNTLILNFTPASHLALQHLIENCPNLHMLELHVTMRTYFSNMEPDTITSYSKILTNIKKLRKHARGKKVFHLHEH